MAKISLCVVSDRTDETNGIKLQLIIATIECNVYDKDGKSDNCNLTLCAYQLFVITLLIICIFGAIKAVILELTLFDITALELLGTILP